MNRNARPKIRLQRTKLDNVLDFVAGAGLLTMIALVIMNYSQLPEQVPTHFGLSGQPDRYSSPESLWVLMGIALLLFAGMIVAAQFPHLHNYTVRITEENALQQYRASSNLLRTVNAITMWTFAGISFAIIRIARAGEGGLGQNMILVWTLVMILLPAGFVLYSRRKAKAD